MTEKNVFVRVKGEFTYRLDSSTLHTVPPGWCGFIPAKEAKRLKSEKKGDVSSAPTPPKSERDEGSEKASRTGDKTGASEKAPQTSVAAGSSD